MLQYGTQITKPGDELRKIPLSEVYRAITRPKQVFRDFITQLRTVATINPNQYRNLKKQLPYIVCGVFHPPVRRKENFAEIQHFILDLDHLSENGFQPETLSKTLAEVPQVMMIFQSPGADGLKVLFALEAPCRDGGLFSSFYKLYAKDFASKYGLSAVVDFRIHDVTRACFLSYDPTAYFNRAATPVFLEDFINKENFDEAEKSLREADKFIRENQTVAREKVSESPDKGVLNKIKQKLNPDKRPVPRKEPYVPPQVDKALELLQANLHQYHLTITETRAIQYGRKIIVKTENIWAEVNIFFGQKGYSVVPTTKSGSNEELAEVARQVIEEILQTSR